MDERAKEIWQEIKKKIYWGNVEPPEDPTVLPFREKAQVFWRAVAGGVSSVDLNALFGFETCRRIVAETSKRAMRWPPMASRVRAARAIWLGEVQDDDPMAWREEWRVKK